MRRNLLRAVAVVLGAGLGIGGLPGAAVATGFDDVWVDLSAPTGRWLDFSLPGPGLDPYDISASAPLARLALPDLGLDVNPADLTISMSWLGSPAPCQADAPSALRMDGWTLIVDPAALAATPMGPCQSAPQGSTFNVALRGHGLRDTVTILVGFRLTAGAPATVAMAPVVPGEPRQDFRTTPAHATAGGTIRIHNLNGTFKTWDGLSARLLDAQGGELGSLDGNLTSPFRPSSEIDLTLPASLPAGAALVEVKMNAWLEPMVAVDIPLGTPSADPVAGYVTAVYSSLFHRLPDAGGLVAWTSALRGGTPYAAVADAITSSDEFRTRLITEVYETFLGRAPDANGVAYWLGRMRAGLQIEDMEAGFLSSDESYQKAGGTNDGWIASLYRTVFGRTDPAGVAAWTLQMARGVTRYQVAIGFTKSTERLSTVVDGYYVTFLGRHGEPSGVAGWVRGIQLGLRDERIVSGFLVSAEYRSRVPAA